MEYRKKPDTIEAFQYDGDILSIEGMNRKPEWFKRARELGIAILKPSPITYNYPAQLFIKTRENETVVEPLDYVTINENGEIHVFKPDIFEKAYELADDPPPQIMA